MRFGARFIESFCCHKDTILIIQRPQPFIEHPMSIFTKCNAIARVVVPTISELMNMRRVDNASAIYSHKAVLSKCAGVVICWYDRQAKTSFASSLTGDLIESSIFF